MTDMSADVDPLLSTRTATVSSAEAEKIGREHFGIDASATVLSSERDCNFRMRARNGIEYLLKVTNPAENASVTNLQTAALRQLEQRAPSLPVPRVVLSRDSAPEINLTLSDGRQHIVRMMTFLPGQPLSTAQNPAKYRALVAEALAELDLGLYGFDHIAASHDLLWDVTKATRVRPMLEAVHNNDRRKLASYLLDEYETHALPQVPELRAQVIHNDFNPSNILVSESDKPRITRIVDFGDVIKAPLINDLATAAAYQPLGQSTPIEALISFAASFHKRLPLTLIELDVLLDLTRARQVMVAVITEWRAARQPSNRNYILRNNPHAWRCLEQFVTVRRSDARRALYRACGLDQNNAY